MAPAGSFVPKEASLRCPPRRRTIFLSVSKAVFRWRLLPSVYLPAFSAGALEHPQGSIPDTPWTFKAPRSFSPAGYQNSRKSGSFVFPVNGFEEVFPLLRFPVHSPLSHLSVTRVHFLSTAPSIPFPLQTMSPHLLLSTMWPPLSIQVCSLLWQSSD